LGPEIDILHQRLSECRSFPERKRIADDYLARKARSIDCGASRISQAAQHLTVRNGACTVEELAHLTGFSLRQFERVFRYETGVSPKLYARIIRFEAAVGMKAACPHRSWMEVAHELGYHDQMHMIHDFRRLAGETPTDVFSMTERVFGPHAQPLR
jgi:transcriptional regulator GlxA family with amidase domain